MQRIRVSIEHWTDDESPPLTYIVEIEGGGITDEVVPALIRDTAHETASRVVNFLRD